MKKGKRKRKRKRKLLSQFSERNTLRMLRNIIIIFIIISIVFEFIPDVCNIYEIFDNHKFVAFIQTHKDFFINIILGCLGSAVISFFVLYISIKTNENEKKEILIELSKKTITEFLRLISYINEKPALQERNISVINSHISLQVDEFFDRFYQTAISNHIISELHFIMSKIYIINNEVSIFFEELQKSNVLRGYMSKENYEKNIKKVYKALYNVLNDEYSFDALLEKIDKLSVCLG